MTLIPWEAVAAALVAAVMHAAWNAGLKGGKDRLLDAALLFGVAGSIGIVSTLFVPAMNPQAWLWLGITVALHLPYVYLLARAYELGELGHVYTIARGLPPLMITGLAVFAVSEIPTPASVFGITLISMGILIVGMSAGAHLRGTLIAAAVATTIALYSVSDGIGVRLSGNTLAYNGWLFFGVGLATMIMAAMLRRGQVIAYAKTHWRRAAIGGVLSYISYGLVLWAMTIAPIASVSAFRETSVVFAALIGMLFFGEEAGKRRIIGAGIVAVGAVVLKLA
ncbi:MAG: EamA family transporter [Alphaproteobacteria bacterium]|nr:EamA family transporter [Alphaproteobacteria bacterium]